MRINAKTVRGMMVAHGYTQTQLAEVMGVSRQSVSLWSSKGVTGATAVLLAMWNADPVGVELMAREAMRAREEGDHDGGS